MHARSSSTVVLVYVGTVAAALGTIAFGLSTILTASVGESQAGATDRTLLQAQVESSREIRRALTAPIAIPPLLRMWPERSPRFQPANVRPWLSRRKP
jgi:hypothetical protein